jgi:flagellar motility protein MotE (MotC chaperone)
MDMLKTIEQRLNLLRPNPELESEWAELRELGDQYRTLEAQIQAKMKTWNAVGK